MEKIFAKTENSLNVTKDGGFTTLHIAAINNHLEIAKILLQKVIESKFYYVFFLFFAQDSLYGLKCLCENLKSVACIQSNTEYNVFLVVSWGDNHKTRGYYYTYSSPVKTRNKPTCRFCISQVTNKLISLFPVHCSSTLLWRGCYFVIHSMRFPQDVLSWPEGGALEDNIVARQIL